MKYNFIAQISWEKFNSGPADKKIDVKNWMVSA